MSLANNLQTKELRILEFLAHVNHCQEQHLQRFSASLTSTISSNEKSATTRLINSLLKQDLITKTALLHKQNSFISLSKSGAKLLGFTKAPPPVNLATYEHDMLVVDLFLHLQAVMPQALIKTDTELKREQGTMVIKSTVKRINVPDLLINNQIAVEVELTLKTTQRLQEIIQHYLNNPQIVEVHYYVRNKTILTKIKQLSFAAKKFRGFIFSNDITQAQAVYFNDTSANINMNASGINPGGSKLQQLLNAGISDWQVFWQALKS